MDFDLSALGTRERYFLLTAAVVPRPIAWVSSLDADGRRNLAPFSYFNLCSATPPILHFTTTTGRKDSRDNVLATREFVVNIVTPSVARAMRISSAAFPAEADEFDWAGVTAEPSARVNPPRVAEARIVLECRLRQALEMGEGTMLFGDIVHVRVDPAVWRDGRIDFARLQPIGRLSGMNYATVEHVYRLEMPTSVASAVDDYQVQGGRPESTNGGLQ
jgi:flavin reductase (DIM6/NTAB) family NADH-FMN oxidoreductase RutF